MLDIAFKDDESRIRKGNAPLNMGIIKHVALNRLRLNQRKRESIKGLRKIAGWNNQRLSQFFNEVALPVARPPADQPILKFGSIYCNTNAEVVPKRTLRKIFENKKTNPSPS